MKTRVAALSVVVVLLVLAVLLLLRWPTDDTTETAESSRPAGPGLVPSRPPPTSPVLTPSPSPTGEEELAGVLLRPARGSDAGGYEDGGAPALDDQAAQAEALQRWLAENAAAAEKYVDRYCEETRGLQGRKALAEPPRNRDAALYLAGRTDWEGGRLGLLHLPESITSRMGNPPQAWRSAGPELYAGLDFSWMTELLQFDHWTMMAAGPLRDDDAVSFFEAPLPNYVTLQYWVKLRLLKGLHEHDLARASQEVRHLATLCASNGTLVSEMIRVSLYGIERKTWEDLGQPMPEGGLTADDASQARHATLGGPFFLYPGVPRAVREKALKCIPTRCAALLETIGVTASFSALVPSTREDLAWLLEQKPCDEALARRLTRSPPVAPEILRQLQDMGGIKRAMEGLTDGGL